MEVDNMTSKIAKLRMKIMNGELEENTLEEFFEKFAQEHAIQELESRRNDNMNKGDINGN